MEPPAITPYKPSYGYILWRADMLRLADELAGLVPLPSSKGKVPVPKIIATPPATMLNLAPLWRGW